MAAPDFNLILKRYGSVQIRNVATIAGNIATASPIGDTLPLLLSLDASVVLEDTKKKLDKALRRNLEIQTSKVEIKTDEPIIAPE